MLQGAVAKECMHLGVAVVVAGKDMMTGQLQTELVPAIRLTILSLHTKEGMDTAVKTLEDSASAVTKRYPLEKSSQQDNQTSYIKLYLLHEHKIIGRLVLLLTVLVESPANRDKQICFQAFKAACVLNLKDFHSTMTCSYSLD